jgi:hypothetical protein
MQRAAIAGVAAMVLAFVVVGVVILRSAPAAQETPTPAGGEEDAIPGLETFEVASAAHVEGTVDYDQDPPAGGPHNPIWQDCGFYDEPVINEHAVHSQEHGAVWITYRPDLPTDQIGVLRRLAERNDYVLVSPYPGLPAPVVASAWGRQLKLDRADDPRLRDFVRAFAGNGPEPGGPCSGGTSETVPLPAGTPIADPTMGTPAAVARS